MFLKHQKLDKKDKMKTQCKGCGTLFDGKGEKFCNNVCRDSYVENLAKRIREAVKNDPNHTQNLSKDF